LEVLIRVQAPDLPENQITNHTPKRLSVVVDRSGSMSGNPLNEALRCVMHIAKHLTPKDQMSLVVYDEDVDVLVPLKPMTLVSEIEQAVEQVVSGGMTNLFGGWKAGAEQLEGSDNQTISRVLLLSDGQANRGETQIDRIEAHCKAWADKGVSTTTIGLGRNFNEDLMLAMARAGGGQQYYGQGVIVELLNTTTTNPDGTYKMNDLAWGSESWLGFRLHISPSAAGSVRDLLAVSVTGVDLQGQALSQSGPMLQLPVVEASAFARMPEDELAQRRLLELEFGKASQELRTLAKAGDAAAAKRLMAQMEERFGGHAWLKAKLEQLHRLAEEDMEMMIKEVSFSAQRMSNRLASKQEMSYMADETESIMPSFLRKKESEGRGRRNQK
jgi:Ca-activated chloride channel family protein